MEEVDLACLMCVRLMLNFTFQRQMTLLFCNYKSLWRGPLGLNAKSNPWITRKTLILLTWYQNFIDLFSRFCKKASIVHFGLSFLLYLRLVKLLKGLSFQGLL